jgi:hypothetical protein
MLFFMPRRTPGALSRQRSAERQPRYCRTVAVQLLLSTRGRYFRSSQTCFISRPNPSRSGKTTDSVTPLCRRSTRILEMFSGSESISISFMKSCSLYSLASQKGSSPNTTNRLRWAATRRVICGKSKTKGNSGMGNSSRSSLSAGR